MAAPAAPLVSVFVLALLAACGQATAPTNSAVAHDGQAMAGDAQTGDALTSDAPVDQASATDAEPATEGVSGDDADGSDDAAATDGDVAPDAPVGGCEFPSNPAKGEPGHACEAASDCDNGACVVGPAGKICTSACSSCCPSGFKCEEYQPVGGDKFFACIPKLLALCRPCDSDDQCGKLAKDTLCVSYPGVGSFCGGACLGDADCPAEFKCQDAQGEKGAGKQCVRTSGACSCSPEAIADGAQTTCKITNAFGTCSSVRKCALSGLPACTAATPALEVCENNVDDDCNGQTDEIGASGCTPYWSDGDGDGDGKAGSSPSCQCAPSGLFTATTATDCSDADKAVFGSAQEQCDGLDNNCNGATDEGCDDDGDQWCDAGMVVQGDPIVCQKGKKDCDDASAAVNPGVQEACGNGIDDDCDGLTDSGGNVGGCVAFYTDSDGDGFGAGDPACLCAAKGAFSATQTGDCADADPNIHPGAVETCGNGKDDDCNSQVDEAGAAGCVAFYVDLDSDGFGTATPTCLCAADTVHTALKAGDCDDGALGINPAATETCNTLDDNCNGTTDELGALGCSIFYADGDGDTFGNPATGLCVCGKNALLSTANGSDCNDDAAAAHPGALETCDTLDNDCDGLTDEVDAQNCTPFFADADGDTYGDSTKSACLCGANATYKTATLGDCNDGDASIHAGAKEICDSIDNNCENGVDEAGAGGCTQFWRDHDGDTYGASADSLCLCAATGEYTSAKQGDCNDNDKTVNPKALETCDSVDNDCDGSTDPINADGCNLWYVDKDGDGYGTTALASKCLCSGIGGYSTAYGDCNDNAIDISPAATEVCNGVDDNCDNIKDPKNTKGCVNYFLDTDADGYGQSGIMQCLCAADGFFSATQSGDCAVGDPQINPGMPELCDGIDNNCSSSTDEGLVATYYSDNDLDGYGVTASGVVLCGPDATHKVATPGDCDDGKIAVNPGASEICNAADDNCNGQTDENLPLSTYYQDSDVDGYGVGGGVQACGALSGFGALIPGDCNDGAQSIHPFASETCNLVDDNCDGGTDEGLATLVYYQDVDSDGWGSALSAIQCGPLPPYTKLTTGDCNDGQPLVSPGATEVCGNNVDDNCDTQTDEGCNTCTAKTLVDFENADVSAWSTTGAWKLFTVGFAGLYSLEYTSASSGTSHGMPVGDSASATGTISVPSGSTAIALTAAWQPYYKSCVLPGLFCSKTLDSSAKLEITILGVTTTINTTTNPTAGLVTVQILLPVVPTKTTAIPITVKATTGGLSGWDDTHTSGYMGIDDIRVTCP